MDGQGLIVNWLRFLWGLIRASASLSARGSLVDIIMGLFAVCFVATIALIPLLILTIVFVVQKLIGAFKK